MKARRILGFILIFYLTLNINIIKANRTNPIILKSNDFHIQGDKLTTSLQTSSLIINDDSDFITLNLPGSGTSEDPYLIENYQISTTDRVAGIEIRETTKHFIIQNCIIETDSWGIIISEIAPDTALITNNELLNNDYTAIDIYKSLGVTISNNNFENNHEAILLKKSSYAAIRNNSFEGNWIALIISGTGSCNIEKNFFTSNVITMSITAVTDFIIKDNIILNSTRYGINLYSSDDTLVLNNTCSDSGWQGIMVRQSQSVTLNNNTLTNDGVLIDEYSTKYGSILNNIVNSRILGFFKNKDDLEIIAPIYGQLILLGCNRGHITNQILSNTSIGITLYNSEKTTITLNTCNNNDGDGIRIYDSDECLVANNTCNNNDKGISVTNSDYCNVSNNTLVRNWVSIEFTNSNLGEINFNDCLLNKNHGITVLYSEWCFVNNNNCSDNHNLAIQIMGSRYFVIANNSCINNIDGGINIPTSSYGIIYNNFCKNSTYGIFIGHSGYSLIPEYVPPPPASNMQIIANQLQENREYGIYLDRMTEDNNIHHNSFINNTEEGIAQAYDKGKRNRWIDTKTNEGNYWSNYNGVGNYEIAGEANSIDKYPLLEPKNIAMPEIPSEWSIYRAGLNLLIVLVGITALVLLQHRKLRNKSWISKQ